MRKVSIKSLYKNLSKEMSDLPFEVTNRGKRIAFVVSGLDCTYPGLDNAVNQEIGLDKKVDAAKDGIDKVQSMTGFSGSYSKAQQTGGREK